MKPFVANETAIIRVYRGNKKIQVKTLKFTAVNNNTAGVATIKVKSAQAGLARASRSPTRPPPRSRPRAPRRSASPSCGPSAALGSTGPAVRCLQSKLAALHYVTSTGGRLSTRPPRAP